MTGAQEMRDALREVMRRGAGAALSDEAFNALALRVFRYQFDNNIPYQRYCERRAGGPDSIEHWTQIPAVPTAAFKEVDLVAGSRDDAQLVFHTSGTTRGREKRGVHYVLDASLYEDSFLPTFREFMLPDCPDIAMMTLALPETEQPDSSLACMITGVMRAFSNSAEFVASAQHGLDVRRARRILEEATEPICLLGTSLSYVHLLDSLRGDCIALPAGSRLMDTGGFKGDEREVSAHDLRARYKAQLGIPADHCINEYGMTELCSQYYDAALRDGPAALRVKKGPPWLRARVLDPETLAPMPAGETGILAHFDLANLHSVSAVLTEDRAYEQADGFVLLGRAPDAMPRGCSIAMDILLRDAEGA